MWNLNPRYATGEIAKTQAVHYKLIFKQSLTALNESALSQSVIGKELND